MAIQELQGHQIASIAVDPLVQQIKCRAVPGATVDTGIPQLQDYQIDGSILGIAKAGCSYPGDPYWSYVVLAMHLDGTNGSTSFIDEKSNTVTIASGSPTLTTSVFKFGTASLLSTTTSKVKVVTPNFTLVGSEYTIEGWVYFNSLSGDTNFFVNTGTENIYIYVSGTSLGAQGGGVSYTSTGTSGLTTGVWTHIALTKSLVGNASTLKIYVNGVLKVTGTGTQSLSSGAGSWTLNSSDTLNRGIDGYMDDIRITKGIVRYTTNFTPPTATFFDF